MKSWLYSHFGTICLPIQENSAYNEEPVLMRYSMNQEQIMLPEGFTIRDSSGDRYVIEGLLGKGRVGAVYLVRDWRVKQRLFALKEVINPNKQDRERFIFEAEILKRLDHRALPRVHRIFEHGKLKRVYMLM